MKEKILETAEAKKVVEEIKKVLPDEDVSVIEVLKINNTKRTGICINGMNFYVEQLPPVDFPRYEGFIESIKSAYMQNKDNLKKANNFKESIKEINNVSAQIISTADNEEFLKNVPHRNMEVGLSIIYRDILEDASYVITNDIMKHHNLDEELLYEMAKKSAIEDFAFVNMSELNLPFLMSVSEMSEMGITEEELKESEKNLVIISNSSRYFGAAEIAFEENYRRIQTLIGSDKFMILPSSTHEVLISAYNDINDLDVKEANRTINEINNNSGLISPEDVLFNELLVFDGEKIKKAS